MNPVQLPLPFTAPLLPDSLFGHLAATAVPGVEEWRDGAYRRTICLPHGPGIVSLTPGATAVSCRLLTTDPRDQEIAVRQCRWLLDLDADPDVIDTALSHDPVLAPLVAKAPGRRMPRSVDGT